jgi:DNA-binding ferritin-like protein
MTDEQFTSLIRALLAHLRAGNLWYHGAHHVTVGAGFHGDHKFYQKVYEQYEADFDRAAEKAIALLGPTIAAPQAVSLRAAQLVQTMPAVSGLPGQSIAASALQVEKQTLTFVEKVFRDLEAGKRLSLGMNNFLSQLADDHETFVYKLGQRIAGGQV